MTPVLPGPASPSDRAPHCLREQEGAPREKFRFRRAVAGLLVLLAAVAVLAPRSPAQGPELLRASASGEYSADPSELPELLRAEWVQQKRLLLESFEQQAIDVREDNRSSQRELREDAAEARRQAREEYREEERKLGEEHADDLQSSLVSLSPERFQRKREDLREKYLDDLEDLRSDQERLVDEIEGDFREKFDEVADDLEQSLFDLQTEKQYALEQLEAEKLEALRRHYQRQLEMEALRMIMSSMSVGPLGDQILFDILDYLRNRVSIEAAHKDLDGSRFRIAVTMRSDPAIIEEAAVLFDLSEGQKTPGGVSSPIDAPPVPGR